MTGNTERCYISKKTKQKAEQMSDITGMPLTKSFGMMSQTVPKIKDIKITRMPRSKKKKYTIIGEWNFEMD